MCFQLEQKHSVSHVFWLEVEKYAERAQGGRGVHFVSGNTSKRSEDNLYKIRVNKPC